MRRRKGWSSHIVLVKSLDLPEPQTSYLKDEAISGVCGTFEGSEVAVNLVGTSLVPLFPHSLFPCLDNFIPLSRT